MRSHTATRAFLLMSAITALAAVQVAAQTTVNGNGTTLRETVDGIGQVSGTYAFSDALALGVALENATQPLGSSAVGFSFSTDPASGVVVRGSQTFGSSFAESALTSGKGKATFGINFLYSKFDEIGGNDLGGFTATTWTGTNKPTATADLSMDIKSTSVNAFLTAGITDRLDVSATIPFVSTSVKGTVTDRNFNAYLSGIPALYVVQFDHSSSGIGDVAVQGKFQVYRSANRDPLAGTTSAFAVVAGARLPTGDEENLRGLGFARFRVGGVYSAHSGKVSPHASFAYEFWADTFSVETGTPDSGAFEEASGAMDGSVGVEVAAAPVLTLNADLLVQSVRGAGKIDTITISGVNTVNTLASTDAGPTRVAFVPGVRWNIGGKALLTANVLLSLKNDGLRAKVVPSVGFEWAF